MDGQALDILYQAASVWNELTEYSYALTYGYKKQLYTVNLTFSLEDFPHLAGFQYLRDLSLPRYNPRKTVDRILNHKITFEQITKGEQYEEFVKPRLEALTRLKDIIEKDFSFFFYMPRMYPFTTMIKADYLISSHLDTTNFVFIIKAGSDGAAKCDYLCCSAFIKGDRDYECNQRTRTILKKERLHISSQESKILYDRLMLTDNTNSLDCSDNA
ncbi:MAG: PBECR4 domain-containing protein [Clostridiales bacterium]|nr:PBECR4 domain-containing protein [Clostridiales bacterium]